MDVLAQYIVDWILEDSKITRVEKYILLITKIMGFCLTIVQISALIGGSYLILVTVSDVDFDLEGKFKQTCMENITRNSQKNGMWDWNTDSGVIYCNYSVYMFTACLVTMTWSFLLLGWICFAYIWYGIYKMEKSQK